MKQLLANHLEMMKNEINNIDKYEDLLDIQKKLGANPMFSELRKLVKNKINLIPVENRCDYYYRFKYDSFENIKMTVDKTIMQSDIDNVMVIEL